MQWPYKTHAKHLLPCECICIHRKPYVYGFWVNEVNLYKCQFCYTIDGLQLDNRAGTGWVLHVLMMNADFQSRLFLEQFKLLVVKGIVVPNYFSKLHYYFVFFFVFCVVSIQPRWETAWIVAAIQKTRVIVKECIRYKDIQVIYAMFPSHYNASR